MTETKTESRGVLMIVEDDGATRLALGRIFSRRGWEVYQAIGVADAMDQLDYGAEPDAIILDLTLPDGSGEVVLRKVRYEGRRSHVAVFTGTVDPRRLIRVRGLHPDLLLIKPIDPDVLCNLFDGWSRTA